ncbi:MAG: sigma-70 family RNA polymerase sigma factor [Chloroflexi bacterium]|nr:sigma-70 family RNA polymerase sigma factor [Chloroflexota bacterium]
MRGLRFLDETATILPMLSAAGRGSVPHAVAVPSFPPYTEDDALEDLVQPPERRYALTSRVAAEAAQLPPLGSAEFWRAIENTERSSRLRAETVVIALRRVQAAGDAAGVQRAATALVLGWESWIRNLAWRQFPRSEDDREDFINSMYVELLERALDPTQGFWEANFVHALRMLGYTVFRQLQRGRRMLTESDLDVDREADVVTSPLEQTDPQADTPGSAFVREALGYLDEPYRSAVYYHYVEGWPVVNRLPGGPSIARLLGVSDRQVRTYVRRGLEQLRDRYGEGEAGR